LDFLGFLHPEEIPELIRSNKRRALLAIGHYKKITNQCKEDHHCQEEQEFWGIPAKTKITSR
jgi:hypothetical protein